MHVKLIYYNYIGFLVKSLLLSLTPVNIDYVGMEKPTEANDLNLKYAQRGVWLVKVHHVYQVSYVNIA